jgi:hypothetical protein
MEELIMEVLEIILSIVTGIAACIPLVIQLVKYIQAAAKEKNWGKLIVIVSNFIAEAETMFPDGASKKEYVINSVLNISKTIDYPVDKEMLGELIDNLVTLSNKVNVNKK